MPSFLPPVMPYISFQAILEIFPDRSGRDLLTPTRRYSNNTPTPSPSPRRRLSAPGLCSVGGGISVSLLLPHPPRHRPQRACPTGSGDRLRGGAGARGFSGRARPPLEKAVRSERGAGQEQPASKPLRPLPRSPGRILCGLLISKRSPVITAA